MAVEDLPAGFTTFDRGQIQTRWLRDYKLRNPSADVTSGQPVLDAAQIADALLPLYGNAKRIADGINESASRGVQLDRVGARIGLPRGKATGASGYGAVDASVGGFTAFVGDELENPATRLRYQAAVTTHLDDGDHIRIKAKSTGPGTDLPPGTVLRWISPRPGSGQNVTVVEQGGGRGLSGGAEVESDERYLARIEARKRNPPAGDNDAELVEVIERTPDVPVERVFTYPGAFGPGSTAYTFTVLPAALGASRVPTSAQLEAVAEWLAVQFPADDSYFPLLIVPAPLVMAFGVSWAVGAWHDNAPWPELVYDEVQISDVTSALEFEVTAVSGDEPLVGSVIALWDAAKRAFRRKTIKSFTGSNPWQLVCETANGASDTSYTPVVGQLVSPWSDNLDHVPPAVLAELAKMGPGELFSAPDLIPAEGRRRRRVPKAPKEWPFAVPARTTLALQERPEVLQVINLLGVEEEPSVGVPPTMLELSDLAFFPY